MLAPATLVPASYCEVVWIIKTTNQSVTHNTCMSHSCSSACSRSADPVLPSVPQGVVSASLQDAAYTKWTHQHPPSYGGGEEIPTIFLAQTDRQTHTRTHTQTHTHTHTDTHTHTHTHRHTHTDTHTDTHAHTHTHTDTHTHAHTQTHTHTHILTKRTVFTIKFFWHNSSLLQYL